jgi:hypothetical protein
MKRKALQTTLKVSLLIPFVISSLGCNFFTLLETPLKVPEKSSLPRYPGLVSKLDSSLGFDEKTAAVSAKLKKGDFASIEAEANEARHSKERLLGGYWKIYAIYSGLEQPNSKQNSTDTDWRAHISRLEAWKTALPRSITARVALAGAWSAYGTEARGEGLANTVSDESWKLFQERYDKAYSELQDAQNLDEKCPQWYEAMLRIGLAQSWPRSTYDTIFEEGFAFAPTYYHIQRQKVNYLLPQWNGEEGDLAKFIIENSSRIEGDEGQIMYFLLCGTLQPVYRGDLFRNVAISWESVKAGYAALQKQYGADRYRKNQYAFLAIYGKDMETAALAMNEIGTDWDEIVWGNRQRFDGMKTSIETFRQLKASQSIPRK